MVAGPRPRAIELADGEGEAGRGQWAIASDPRSDRDDRTVYRGRPLSRPGPFSRPPAREGAAAQSRWFRGRALRTGRAILRPCP